MQIEFFNCESPRNYVNKTLVKVGRPISISWKEDNPLISPYIKLSNYVEGNYCRIFDYNTIGYYFVKSIHYLQGGLYGLELELDPLFTYKDNLISAEIKVEQTEIIPNKLEIEYTRDNALVLIGG